MAAVRAGAVGFSRSPRFTIYSSRKFSDDWSTRKEEGDKPQERKGRGYGVALSSPEMAQTRYQLRRRMLDLKRKFADCSFFLALAGLIFAVIDVEVSASLPNLFPMYNGVSHMLRIMCLFTTAILLLVLIAYHFADAKVYLIETGSGKNWRLGCSTDRVLRVLLEVAVCAICPIPDTGSVEWPLLSADAEKTRARVRIPWNVLLCLPMFSRIYLLCRYIVLHSSHYQDATIRTIASLNHVPVDFKFVVRSQLYARPLRSMAACSLCFWFIISWMITQCERYSFPDLPGYIHFIDYLWFDVITFFSIGYGDIQVQTYCGRGLAMITAIVGTLFSSTLIALVGRRLVLSTSEKRVNHLIAENQLSIDNKNAAARVLQYTWRTVVRQRQFNNTNDAKSALRLTNAQRRLLKAVLIFRKTRWRIRMQHEEEDDYFTARRAFLETEERLRKVRMRQTQLDAKLSQLFESVEKLTHIVLKKYR